MVATTVLDSAQGGSIRERMITFEVNSQRVIIDPLPRSDLDAVVDDQGWDTLKSAMRIVKRAKAGFPSRLTAEMRRDHWRWQSLNPDGFAD